MTQIMKFSKRLSFDKSINNIIQGDCLQVMKEMPDKCVDIIATSPPYNLLTKKSGLYSNKGKWSNNKLHNGYDNYSDNMTYEQYVFWQRECLTEMLRILKDDGAIFYNNKNRIQNGLLENRGDDIVRDFPLRQIVTWQRKGGINFNQSYYLPTTEQIYIICRKPFKLTKGANKLTDVWQITQERNNPHPAPYPEELTDTIMKSVEGNIVLDPFGGSGTTAVSALKANKNFILIEQSEQYCQLAKARINGEDNWRDYLSKS